ncbi:MAG: response regulator [Actinomycetes bacterium]
MSSPSARIVVADDEAIIRLDLKELLIEAGYDVVGEAANGEEALVLINEHKPDLAILDVKMPKMDGISVARELQANHEIPVLLLTAFSQRDLIEEARAVGVAAYLVKPFRRAELLPAVERVLTSFAEDRAIAAVDELASAYDPDDKIETRRLIDEAKALLMAEAGLLEEAAFLFIQQTAMSSRLRMRDLARQIISGELRP